MQPRMSVSTSASWSGARYSRAVARIRGAGRDARLDVLDELRAHLREQLDGRGAEGVVVGERARGGLRADDADAAVAGDRGGLAGGRHDHLDDRHVVALAGVAQGCRRARVAGDDEGLHAPMDEIVEGLQDEAAHLGDRARAVGGAGRVAQVEDVLVRQQVDDRAGHRQATEAGVEDADRRVRVARRGGRVVGHR